MDPPTSTEVGGPTPASAGQGLGPPPAQDGMPGGGPPPPPPPSPPTHSQQVALALTPKITGFLSLLGSSYIIYDAFRKLQNGKRKDMAIYHRILIGLSIFDLLASIAYFMSTWPMPSDTRYTVWATGTDATCSAAGFFVQGTSVAVIYSASLSTYYLLKIRYGMAQTQLLRIEPILHLVPITFGISTMVTGLAMDLYHPGAFDCYIHVPQECRGPPGMTLPEECGMYHSIHWYFDLGPRILGIIVITINMLLIYNGIKRQETATKRFSVMHRFSSIVSSTIVTADSSEVDERKQRKDTTFQMSSLSSLEIVDREQNGSSISGRADQGKDRGDGAIGANKGSASFGNIDFTIDAGKENKPPPRCRTDSATTIKNRGNNPRIIPPSVRMARQSFLFVGAFYITYLPPFIPRLRDALIGMERGPPPFWMVFLISFFLPLQGFWNMLIYLRPRYMLKRERQLSQQQQRQRRSRQQRSSGSNHHTMLTDTPGSTGGRHDDSPERIDSSKNHETNGTRSHLDIFRDISHVISETILEGGLDEGEEEDVLLKENDDDGNDDSTDPSNLETLEEGGGQNNTTAESSGNVVKATPPLSHDGQVEGGGKVDH